MPQLLRLAFASVLAVPVAASAQTYTTIYTFPANGRAGTGPFASLLVKGNYLYGTTRTGGASKSGTLFRVNATTGAEKVLYSFGDGLKDGATPASSLIYQNHFLWGTTLYGGSKNLGTVYKFDLQTGILTIVHSFLGKDGANPGSELVSAKGYLYGTAGGGTDNRGVVFKIDPTTDVETVIYNFDGRVAEPAGGLIYYKSHLYGLTSRPLKKQLSLGAAFALDPDTGTLTVLHKFGQDGDGASPDGHLVLDGGELYGTTGGGGASNLGTVFKLDPVTGYEAVLHSFQGKDGNFPASGVILQDGKLYGTTLLGSGHTKYGTVFELDPTTGVEKVLHGFSNREAARPIGGLVASGGNLYGTTFGYFDYKKGCTVFMVTP